MHLSSRTTSILIVTVLIGVLMAGMYGWLVFYVQSISGNIEMLENTIASRALEEGRLRTAENLLEGTAKERAQIQSFFVTDESVVLLIETVEKLGENADVSLTIASVETDDASSGDILGAVRIRLATTGSWRDTIHFLALLDTLPFVSDILAADLEQSSSAGEVWQGTFTMRVGMIK